MATSTTHCVHVASFIYDHLDDVLYDQVNMPSQTLIGDLFDRAVGLGKYYQPSERPPNLESKKIIDAHYDGATLLGLVLLLGLTTTAWALV